MLPEGTGPVNRRGLDFYDRLVDACQERDLRPWLTVYHWDLPLALQQRGGWTNRAAVGWLAAYAQVLARRLGDRVQHWMVLNEPMVFVGPGTCWACTRRGGAACRRFWRRPITLPWSKPRGVGRCGLSCRARIGTTFSCSYVTAARPGHAGSEAAARRVDALLNRFFVEPTLGLGYPTAELPLLGAALVPAAKRGVPTTEMGWEVYPESIYQMVKQYAAYPGAPELFITESGAAFADEPAGGRVADAARRAYFQVAIGQVLRARREGIWVNGYFPWSFTDNFEWAKGYRPRFGLVHVDYETQERIVKDSGRWYGKFLGGAKVRVGQ